jgi:hypothetical protein
MRWVRRLIYRAGIRPRPGSIFFSSTLHYEWLAVEANRELSAAIERATAQLREIISLLPHEDKNDDRHV